MSITIMKLAWDAQLPPPEKLILLSLSDQANDDGVTWPSVSSITKKTGMSERTVFRHLSVLESLGHIHREQRVGTSTIYYVHPCQNDTPVKMTPMSLVTPTHVTSDIPPLSRVTPTPATVGRQKHQEPPLNHQGTTKKKSAPAAPLPEWLPADVWDDFLAHRKAMKSAMTARAQSLAIGELTKLKAEGHNPADVIKQSIMRGWKGLFAVSGQSNNGTPKQESYHEKLKRTSDALCGRNRVDRSPVIDGTAERVD